MSIRKARILPLVAALAAATMLAAGCTSSSSATEGPSGSSAPAASGSSAASDAPAEIRGAWQRISKSFGRGKRAREEPADPAAAPAKAAHTEGN